MPEDMLFEAENLETEYVSHDLEVFDDKKWNAWSTD